MRCAWLLLALSGCAHRFVECNDTLTCRAQMAERNRQFALEIADEPPADRLDVEPISRLVLVDRNKQLVYALTPELVALELRNGNERWRIPAASGDSLWRAGRLLAVGMESARLPPKVTFVAPEAPTKPVPCSLALEAPAEAVTAWLHVFDRAGQPYVFWRSDWSYSGGTPPDERAKEREVAADACGVVRLDPRTCAAVPEPLEDFVWEPPEGRRKPMGEPGACAYLSPLLDLPAAAASAPKTTTLLPLLAPAAEGLALRVLIERDGEQSNKCRQVSRLTLEARDATGTRVWARPLEAREIDVCGPI
ncbi:MAG: hypothetical protein Q8L48_16480 [Archangium sp.]|nr:hypothetical protein [Archangium sp.]